MRGILNLLTGILIVGGLFCIVNGHVTLALPARIAIVVGTLVGLSLVNALLGVRERSRRLARNQEHCAQCGFNFLAVASINDVFHDARLFRNNNVRIEQLARGVYGNIEVDVFDLQYETTSHGSEGGTHTHTHRQTVASIPGGGSPGLRLCVLPLRGISGRLLRFLGLTASISTAPKATGGDRELVAWFSRNYVCTWGDESSKKQAERLLTPSVLEWLRAHEHPAFEIVDSQLLIWHPSRLVDSKSRDDLANIGLDLAQVLQKPDEVHLPSVSLAPPVITSVQGLMLRMMISGIGSWLLALVVAIGGFFIVIALGWPQRAPVATMVGLMSIIILVWCASGVLIYRYLA